MKILFIAVCIGLFSSSDLIAQTGYFGKKNSVALIYNGAPTLRIKSVLKGTETDPFVKSKRRLVNSSYSIKYTRILSNKVSINLGVDVASMHSFKGELIDFVNEDATGYYQTAYTDSKFIEPTISYRGVSLGFNFFGYYGINPVGLRTGISFDYGSLISDYSDLTVFETESYDPSIGTTVSEEIFNKNFERYTSSKMNVIALRWNVGRNIIITRQLLLKIDASFNLASYFLGQTYKYEGIGTAIADAFTGPNFSKSFDTRYSTFESQEYDNYRRTYTAYKRFNINIGLSYAF